VILKTPVRENAMAPQCPSIAANEPAMRIACRDQAACDRRIAGGPRALAIAVGAAPVHLPAKASRDSQRLDFHENRDGTLARLRSSLAGQIETDQETMLNKPCQPFKRHCAADRAATVIRENSARGCVDLD
jgi:hypothetical protein